MFSVSLTHSVSHGYDFVHILAYAWEIKLFTENVIKILNICMLNMFTFHLLQEEGAIFRNKTFSEFGTKLKKKKVTELLKSNKDLVLYAQFSQ